MQLHSQIDGQRIVRGDTMNLCLVTVGNITNRFEDVLIQLTNLELDALAYLCEIYKEEEE